MRQSRLLVVVFASAMLSGCATWNWILGKPKYPLPEGSVSGEILCGQDKCKAGQNGVAFQFTRNPWSPSVNATTTPMEAARQVVGYTSNNPYGRDPFTCAATGPSPFGEDDVSVLGSPDGRQFVYGKTEILDIDVNAAVESDLESLQTAGVISSGVPLSELRAKLTAAYSSLDKSKVKIDARYYEFGLTGSAYRDIFQYQIHEECVEILKTTNERLITGAGLVWFDLEYTSSSAKELISEVETTLQSYGINYNFGASVRKEVTESLSATTSNGFQVITWTTADKSYFRR